MSDIDVKSDTIAKPKIEQPRLYKVVLLNDDYTPREFVVQVLKAVFRTTEDQAYRIMMTAHQRGVCVVATFTRDVAESKATEATDMGRQKGYPLEFSTEPEDSAALQMSSEASTITPQTQAMKMLATLKTDQASMWRTTRRTFTDRIPSISRRALMSAVVAYSSSRSRSAVAPCCPVAFTSDR